MAGIIPEITPKDLDDLLKSNTNVLLLDVRTWVEYTLNHIQNARYTSVSELTDGTRLFSFLLFSLSLLPSLFSLRGNRKEEI